MTNIANIISICCCSCRIKVFQHDLNINMHNQHAQSKYIKEMAEDYIANLDRN